MVWKFGAFYDPRDLILIFAFTIGYLFLYRWHYWRKLNKINNIKTSYHSKHQCISSNLFSTISCFLLLCQTLSFISLSLLLRWQAYKLDSTDAAPEVPHPRPTRLPTRRTASAFFFFFFSRICTDLARFVSMRLNSCRIGFDSHRTGLIWPKSGRIGHIGSYRSVVETGRKTAGTGWNTSETTEISLEYGWKSRNLHSSFFFCESRHSICFLRIF